MVASKLAFAVVLLCGLAACQLTAATTCSKTPEGHALVSKSKAVKHTIYNVNAWTFPQRMGCTSYPTINLCWHDTVRFTSMTAAHSISITNSATCPKTPGPVFVKIGSVLTAQKSAQTKPAGSYLKKNQKKGAVWFYCPVAGHCEGGMIMKVNVHC